MDETKENLFNYINSLQDSTVIQKRRQEANADKISTKELLLTKYLVAQRDTFLCSIQAKTGTILCSIEAIMDTSCSIEV